MEKEEKGNKIKNEGQRQRKEVMMLIKSPPPPSSLSSSSSPTALLASSFLRNPSLSLPNPHLHHSSPSSSSSSSFPRRVVAPRPMNILKRLGFGTRPDPSTFDSTTPQSPDDDVPAPGQLFSQFGAGCFWGVELAFQRVPGVTKTEVGYSQGLLHNPTYEDVCTGTTNHNEVVRVQYDPNLCSYWSLLGVFWSKHDPTSLNRQGNDVGTQYRSGIYYYMPEQETEAKESLQQQQKLVNRKIVTEVLPAKKFYRAEEYHQQYLAKGGRFGFKQSAVKGCDDPIRCYG